MNNVSLYRLFRLFIKNIIVIALSAVVCGVAAFAYCTYFVQEKYSATGSVLATNGGSIFNESNDKLSVQGADINASINLSTTIVDILLTPDIYKQLANELDGEYTYSQLKSWATVAKRSDYSMFIDITFKANNQQEAIIITNTFLELAPDYINKFIPSSSSTAVSMADTAVKTSPKTASATIFAALVGAVICYLVVYLISLNNTTIQNEEDFKFRYDIPILGNIPNFSEVQNNKYTYYYSDKR